MGSLSRLEWPASLDVSPLLAMGWLPLPFREFIVKVHSRCDLSCDYCYMYDIADQSWRSQPRSMSAEIAELAAARRIGGHARAHGLSGITLILRGGEPLLAGRDLIGRLVTVTRQSQSQCRRDAGGAAAVPVPVQRPAVHHRPAQRPSASVTSGHENSG
jgi:uncharacterized protein